MENKNLWKRSLPGLLAALLLSLALLGGCVSKPAQVNMEQAYENMVKSGHLPPMLQLGPEDALNLIGLVSEDHSQQVVMVAQDSLIADEVVLIEARDQSAADRAYQLLEERLRVKANEARNYSPEQYAIIQQGILKREGLNLLLLVSPQADALYAVYNQSK